MVASRNNELSEISSVIGELRNFAAQQVATNQHVLEQLKAISEKISNMGETGVVLAEYRNTLHERFGKIHAQLGSLDLAVERNTEGLHKVQTIQTTWSANIKLVLGVGWLIGTVMSALLSNFGSAILRAIVGSHS